MSQSITLVVAPTTENVRLVGICAGALAASFVGADEGARIELCVVEAMNNVVEHAYANSDATGEQMSVGVELSTAELVIRIIDTGIPAPAGLFESRPELVFDPENLDSLPEGGMGLFIIHDVMDAVEYTSDSGSANTLVLRKTFKDAVAT